MSFAINIVRRAAVAVLCLAGIVVPAQADDGLFSTISVDSVYSKSSDSSDAVASSRKGRVRSADHLGRLLRIEGFGFEKVGERTYGAVTKLDDWSFPTLVTLSEDRTRIGLIAGLVRYDENSALKPEQMLDLLSANQSVAPYQFGFNKDRKRTELTLALNNDGVDSSVLAAQIKKLTEAARDSSEVWYRKSQSEKTIKTAETPSKTTDPGTSEKTNAAITPSKLVGKWTASRSSTEAFALQMTADGKFTLAFVSGGKTTVSKGTFGLQGDSLVLSVDQGASLTGPASLITNDQFTYSPNGGAKLTFNRAGS